ncbi:N-acetyltransferase family protein [Actinophytocola sp.]|uniref:GNAT family N-acetyltransferase n=1 Tax=Actinophytocola sp. TaxID=1872138 RepID=UPI003899B78C
MVTLRVLTLDDWAVWRVVRLAALADAPHAFRVGLADWDRGGEDEWRARLALPGAHNVVAFLGDRPVGVARGVPGADGCELRSVWVAPEARGHGVGGRLLAEVEAWAARTGAASVRLAVFPDNTAAVALYTRHGYVPVGAVAGQTTMVKGLR